MSTTTNGQHPTDERAAAVALWQASADDGAELTGLELGERFGRSARWGRARVAEARAPRHAAAPASSAETWARRVRAVAFGTVIAAAAAVSLAHHHQVALAAGEGWRAWAIPASIDGMLVLASITAWLHRQAGRPVGAVVWFSLALGIGASMAGNIAAAEPTVTGRVIAAWPPLALKLCLAMLLIHPRQEN